MSAINRNSALCGLLLLATFFTVIGCGKDPVATETGTGPMCLAPTDSIVGWWPLDQLGSAAEELVGDNQGDYIEIPLEAEGKVGGALRFDGSNDIIEIRDPGADWDYDIAGDITLETWINRDTDQSNQQVVVGKWGSYYFGCRNGRIFALISNAVDFIGATNMPTGEWIHIAVTYDVDDRIAKIYLNGEIDGTAATSGQNVTVSNGHIYIAGLMPAQQFFDGFIDEVSIYKRALSTSEIFEIYTRGSLGKCKK